MIMIQIYFDVAMNDVVIDVSGNGILCSFAIFVFLKIVIQKYFS